MAEAALSNVTVSYTEIMPRRLNFDLKHGMIENKVGGRY